MTLPRKKFLRLGEKLNVIQLSECGATGRSIARLVGVSRGQVHNILRNKEEIKNQWKQGTNSSRKLTHLRGCLYPEINEKVYRWFLNARRENQPVSGKILQDKAKQIASELGYTGFIASNGWLFKFKRRYSIGRTKPEPQVGKDTVTQWFRNVQDLCKQHGINDTLSLDNTEILYPCMPKGSLGSADQTHGTVTDLPERKVESVDQSLSDSKFYSANTNEVSPDANSPNQNCASAESSSFGIVAAEIRELLANSDQIFGNQTWLDISQQMHTFGWPIGTWFNTMCGNELSGLIPNPILPLFQSGRPVINLPPGLSTLQVTTPACSTQNPNDGITNPTDNRITDNHVLHSSEDCTQHPPVVINLDQTNLPLVFPGTTSLITGQMSTPTAKFQQPPVYSPSVSLKDNGPGPISSSTVKSATLTGKRLPPVQSPLPIPRSQSQSTPPLDSTGVAVPGKGGQVRIDSHPATTSSTTTFSPSTTGHSPPSGLGSVPIPDPAHPTPEDELRKRMEVYRLMQDVLQLQRAYWTTQLWTLLNQIQSASSNR